MTTGMAGFSDPEPDLYVGSVTAIRVWKIYPHRIEHEKRNKLMGNFGQLWEPGENVAKCVTTAFRIGLSKLSGDYNGLSSHDVPVSGCGCGFWAFNSAYEETVRMNYFRGNAFEIVSLVGVVECYGNMLLGPRGLRCEKARIRALTCSDNFSNQDRVTGYYQVPLYKSLLSMLAEHPLTVGIYPEPEAA